VAITLILINFTVKSIITPITDLLDVVESMLNDDMDADVTKNYTPNSEEINQLYQSFSKLKFIMKYANEEFFSGNDAQALINYTNALKLYLELNQKEGIGITYNNIGINYFLQFFLFNVYMGNNFLKNYCPKFLSSFTLKRNLNLAKPNFFFFKNLILQRFMERKN